MAAKDRSLTNETVLALHETLRLEGLQQNGRGMIILTRVYSYTPVPTTLNEFAKEVLDELQKFEPSLVGLEKGDTKEGGLRYKVVVQI